MSGTDGIAQLDPRTGRLMHLIRIPNHSEWDDLAYGDGELWYLEAHGTLTAVNPATRIRLAHTAFGGDPALKGRTSQSWSWVAATAGGVCVGRLASGTRTGVLCFDAALGRRRLVEGGPFPILADAGGKVIAGGSGLHEIGFQPGSASAVPGFGNAHVTALAVADTGLWAAVESEGEHPRAEIWHIVGHNTVSKTMTNTRYIQNIAVNDAGVWVLFPTAKHMVLAAAEPDGTLKRVAMLPADARSLVVTPGALWTANFRGSTVARITGYVQSGRA